MKDQAILTFPSMFGKVVEENKDRNALCFVGENALSYGEVQEAIHAVMRFLETLDIKPGDRVGILSTNMPNWGIAYLAISFMGAIVVPMLPDFMPKEVENILAHSESTTVFVSEGLRPKLDEIKPGLLKNIINIEDFSHAGTEKGSYSATAKPEKVYQVNEEDIAAIIYTSGTTGSSKGVMLSHKNICSNVVGCGTLQPVGPHDRFISILPLSHTLENTVGFLLPILNGASIHYLRKPPSPSVLMPALLEVKPTIMLSVPMVIEKIYFQKILPTLMEKKTTNVLMSIPPMRKLLHRIAGKKLMKTFGGEVIFFGIGGAKLNSTVEKFLIEAKFPYAIGYGLTETAPLLAGAVPGKTRLGSTGLVVEGVTLRINDPDPITKEGEVWAKGPNIMKGYYREPELTKKVLTEDGWFKTGDLGIFDQDQKLYIKGRLKNMIVGSSGENIYPEEIEFVINGFKHVLESVVVEKKGKLVALVHLNIEEMELAYQHLREEVSSYMEVKAEEILKELKDYVNARVNKFSRIHSVIIQQTPFQKTATQKIKRFLYY